MKRFVALVFLFLYAYNIAGYLLLFSVLQYRTRSEVKTMLKESVPETDLTTFAFHTLSLTADAHSLQWIDDHEFRREEKLYDIVRSFVHGDSTYLVCINDVQEERLFEHLDNHVQREMGNSGNAGRFDSFKDVFKDSITKCVIRVGTLAVEGNIAVGAVYNYSHVEPDVPFLPPRSTPA
jgi:hypothetical protein